MDAQTSNQGQNIPKSLTADQISEIAGIQAAMEKIETEYQIAIEWGLFLNPSGSTAINDLEAKFVAAKSACSVIPPRLDEAYKAVIEARRILSIAQCADGNYRANNIFAICPIFITVIVTSLVYVVGVECILGLSMDRLFHHPVFWGLVGATLRSLYWIQRQAGKGWLRPRFFPTLMVSPALGIILGAASALMMKVGAALVAGNNGTTSWGAFALVAFWAGYKWDWALQAMEGAANQLVPEIKKSIPSAASAKQTAPAGPAPEAVPPAAAEEKAKEAMTSKGLDGSTADAKVDKHLS